MTIGTYTMNVRCENCGYEGAVTIPKGKTVERSECPTCGCTTLRKKGFSFPSHPILPKKYPDYHPWFSPIQTPDTIPRREDRPRYWCVIEQ